MRQREYYGEIEELFDPVIKTLNTNSEAFPANSEAMQALQNKTLAAIEDNANVLKALDSRQPSSFLDEQASLPCHDGLYDEILNITKQLLPLKIIIKDQLENCVFNYGKNVKP